MRRNRKAKIIATLGPASSNAETISAMFDAGVDMFRFNMSHGDQQTHLNNYGIVRGLEATTGRPVGTLFDLQGPKLRVGTFVNDKAELKTGDTFRVDLDPTPGDATRAPMLHPEVFRVLAKDTDILIDDGKLRLRIEECGTDYAVAEVVAGGTISNRKGFNIPNLVLPLSPLTKKDHNDLRFALDTGCDWVALSFVQLPEDIAEARKLIGPRARIMAKLEKPSAVEHLERIIEIADAVMVARGDLGVEMPPETVPGVQKRIIRCGRNAGKPVVVATQMLESMIASPQPTRAEASDVATAIYDGADAVMLSGETAAGQYPVDAVEMMSRIVARVETDPLYRSFIESGHSDAESTSADAITAAARQVAETIGAAAVVTYTTSGSTALRAARERPPAPILCLTPSLETARRLSVAWGIHPVVIEDATDLDSMVAKAELQAKSQEFAAPGDRVVITAGVPFGTPGATNLLRIAWIS